MTCLQLCIFYGFRFASILARHSGHCVAKIDIIVADYILINILVVYSSLQKYENPYNKFIISVYNKFIISVYFFIRVKSGYRSWLWWLVNKMARHCLTFFFEYGQTWFWQSIAIIVGTNWINFKLNVPTKECFHQHICGLNFLSKVWKPMLWHHNCICVSGLISQNSSKQIWRMDGGKRVWHIKPQFSTPIGYY